MTNNDPMTIYDVIIIGSGPAGLTAGIYTSRANLRTLCITGSSWGGQLMLTTVVENYPGFPDGIQGPDLMINMRKQAERFGVIMAEENATEFNFDKRPFSVNKYLAQSVIIATGSEFKWLGLPNEQRLIGKGVSACATCDGAFFKDKTVVVVGGGDAAMEEALYLTKFVSSLFIVHRRDQFRASKIMQDKVLANPKIKVLWNTEIKDILGENKVEGVTLNNQGSIINQQCDGVFVAIGHSPATKLFEGKINLDPMFYARRAGSKYPSMSNIEGVFLGGEVHDYIYRQAITTAGYGCEAALDVERWLSENT